MAKAPKRDRFADDYTVESKRIWRETSGVIIWPTWEVYQENKHYYESNRDDPSWRQLLDAKPNLFNRPITRNNFAAWREQQITHYVEFDCKPLVRHIMDKGYFTFYSNAVGNGSKGVGFAEGVFDFKQTNGGYFYFLKNWDTDPKIGIVDYISFGSITCPEPTARENDDHKRMFGFDVLPAPQPAQPARPAKKKRNAKPKRDRAPGEE